MNDLMLGLGLEHWKPVLTALILPPVPFLVLIVLGAVEMSRRRWLAWFTLWLGIAGVWLMSTLGAGALLTQWLLRPPPALSTQAQAELRRAPQTTIVVLGGGRWLLAPEYGVSSLKPRTIERLRYGIWLARQTQLPLGVSGGVGLASPDGPAEAEIAARVAEREFGFKLSWQEAASRDTRENAIKTLLLLQPQGIQRIVLVTHGYHMARAVANFERAAATLGTRVEIVAAPVGLRSGEDLELVDWLPSTEGFESAQVALREWLGRLVGA